MTFANGYTISVQFGTGNYCANRDHRPWSGWMERERATGAQGSSDAEIAIWGTDGNLIDLGGDTVKGWVTPDDLALYIALVSQPDFTPDKLPFDLTEERWERRGEWLTSEKVQ